MKPFSIQTGAGIAGAGAALTQEQGWVERIIAYARRRWFRSDTLRGALERECMTILWAVEYFCPSVAGIHSGHKLLRSHLAISQQRLEP